MVHDVGLANAVEDEATEGAHEGSVDRGKGTSGKGPGLGRVVGDHGVGVLQVGDHDQPAARVSAVYKLVIVGGLLVDPKVRDKVQGHHLGEAAVVGPDGEGGEGEEDAEVGDEDLPSVGGLEDDGSGVKVVCALGVVELSRGVLDQVQGPAEDLLQEHVVQERDGRLIDRLAQLLLARSRDAQARVLALLLDLGVAELLAGSGHVHLVTRQVVRRSVVSAVRDSPRVVRHKQRRVQEPSDRVVDLLRRRERLVTALVPTRGERSSPRNFPVGTHAMTQRPVPNMPAATW